MVGPFPESFLTRGAEIEISGLKLATQIVQAAGRVFPAVAGGEAHVFDGGTVTRSPGRRGARRSGGW